LKLPAKGSFADQIGAYGDWAGDAQGTTLHLVNSLPFGIFASASEKTKNHSFTKQQAEPKT